MVIKKKEAILTYPDYRKFIKFVENKFDLSISHIDPFDFFKLESKISDIDTFFKGRAVKIPEFNYLSEFNNINRFEDFTSRNEVKNISLWALSCLRKISHGADIRLGKELEIIQTKNPRDGRLDVVVLNDSSILIIESKISLSSLLSEGRFRYQIPSYEKECNKIVNSYDLSHKSNHKISIFLLIGGEETDLYPPMHEDCTTGQVGDISKIFYDNLSKYNIKFISANALWALANYSILKDKKINWSDLLPSFFEDKNVIGLLSAGKVIKDKEVIFIEPLNI